MTTLELRKRIAQGLKTLSPDRLQAAYHFIEYLQDRKEDQATSELLSIKGFRSALIRAEKQAATGKTISLSKARRNV